MRTPENRDTLVAIDALGEGARPDHIGLVVPSIEQASSQSVAVFDPEQKVRVAFISLSGMTVELVEPVGEDSPVMNSLRKGNRLLHICYSVPDVAKAIASAQRSGFFCLSAPVPAVAFGGRRIAWMFHKIFGLVELVEESRSDER